MSLAAAIGHANQGKSRIAAKRGTGTSVTPMLDKDNLNNSLYQYSQDMHNQSTHMQIQNAEQALQQMRQRLN